MAASMRTGSSVPWRIRCCWWSCRFSPTGTGYGNDTRSMMICWLLGLAWWTQAYWFEYKLIRLPSWWSPALLPSKFVLMSRLESHEQCWSDYSMAKFSLESLRSVTISCVSLPTVNQYLEVVSSTTCLRLRSSVFTRDNWMTLIRKLYVTFSTCGNGHLDTWMLSPRGMPLAR